MVEQEFELSERKIESREPTKIQCVVFEMKEIRDNFSNSINSIKADLKSAQQIENEGNCELATNVYRYTIAAIESAFDYLLHCLLKSTVKNRILIGQDVSSKLKKLPVPLSYLKEMVDKPENPNPLIEFIENKYSSESFLSFEKLKEILSLIDDKLFQNVANSLYGNDASKFRNFMSKIYSRRNLIVHQDDRKSIDGIKEKITFEETEIYLNELERIALEIINKCEELNN